MPTREENLKKINAELEQLSEEQLDKVAGGYASEVKRDSMLMCKLGLMNEIVTKPNAVDPFRNLERAWAKLNITMIYNHKGYNEYYNSKGESISRDKALQIAVDTALEQIKSINPYEYV